MLLAKRSLCTTNHTLYSAQQQQIQNGQLQSTMLHHSFHDAKIQQIFADPQGLPGLKSWAMIGKKQCAPIGARTKKGTKVPIEASPRYKPGARVPRGRGLQSAFKNRRAAPTATS